jgi:hypothetical protein
MAGVSCRDIFNAVYVNVRESYISKLYSSNVESKTVSEQSSQDENLQMNSTAEPKGETNINTKEIIGSVTQTVRESVERSPLDEVALDIRMDLEERFPYALGAVCENLALLDGEYRKANGLEEQKAFSSFVIDIGDEFPLCEKFAFPCVMFVSSMVLLDIDEKKSDAFYSKYAKAVASVVAQIPCENTLIAEKYPY